MADRYRDTVYRVALNYFGNPTDADDTVQDVLMKLYGSSGEFESEEHVRNWLIRVTVNACRNTLRAPWRSRSADLNELADFTVFQHPEESEVFMAVMGLPEKYRTVLNLFYYEECTVKETARLMGIRESAVTTRLSRAREMLKQKLKEVWQDE